MSFLATTSLPAARYGHAVAFTDSHVWVLGGRNSAGTRQDTVYVASITGDGTLGSWTSTTVLPLALSEAAAVAVQLGDGKTYVLVVGGEKSGGKSDKTYWAEVTGDGTLGSWTESDQVLARGLSGHALFTNVGALKHAPLGVVDAYRRQLYRLHVVGGVDASAVYRDEVYSVGLEQLLTPGSTDAWVSAGDVPAARAFAVALTVGDSAYVLGGTNGVSAAATVYRTTMRADGQTSLTWATDAALPLAVQSAAGAVVGEDVYLLGGYDGSSTRTEVYRATSPADGRIAEWATVSTLPAGRYLHGAAVLGAQLAVLGGYTTAASADVLAEEPPTFDKLVEDNAANGLGYVYRMVVLESGSVTRRYTSAHHYGGDDYEPRLKGLGRIQRGLGMDRFPQSADVEVVLENSDEGADWWVDQATALDAMQARVRLFIGAFHPDAPTVILFRPLGEYLVAERPRRTLTEVRFSLTDSLGSIFEQAVRAPTIRDWTEGDAGCPLNSTSEVEAYLDGPVKTEVLDQPLPVVIGSEVVRAVYCGRNTWAVCAFRVGAEVEPSAVAVEIDGVLQYIPRTIGRRADPVWTPGTSAAFTFAGQSWKVVFITLVSARAKDFFGNITGDFFSEDVSEMRVQLQVLDDDDDPRALTPEGAIGWLARYYTPGGAAFLDTESLARLEFALHGSTTVAGTLGDGATSRQAIGQLCNSFELDAYVTRAGRLGVTGRSIDYLAVTGELADLVELTEAELWDVEERIPSRQERWSYANRAVLRGLKLSPVEKALPTAGPFDARAAPTSGPFFERESYVGWRTWSDGRRNPWLFHGLDGTLRPVLRFNTNLRGLGLEPGQYFRLSWTRNLGTSDPYSSTIFKVEEVDFDPMTFQVSLTAVWFGDAETVRPFLLDDADLLRRCSGSGARTATVESGNSTVTFSSGDLSADGVVAGDFLLLRDATQATASFQRNRALLIGSVDSATALTVTDPTYSLDFDAGSPTAVSAWEIRRGHMTAPASASQPNYPDGSSMYGRLTDSNGAYSDSAPDDVRSDEGHQLL